jgi:hypothetical protein
MSQVTMLQASVINRQDKDMNSAEEHDKDDVSTKRKEPEPDDLGLFDGLLEVADDLGDMEDMKQDNEENPKAKKRKKCL